jgi:hypothetical protein
MASEILGLFTSPEEYQMRQQQAQQQGQQNAALQFAQLNPFERANYGIFRGAQQLGNVGNRLFGGEDPQLRKITMRQQMLSGTGTMNDALPPLDFTNPVALRQASIFALQRGRDPEFAEFLAKKAEEVALSQATTKAKLREKPPNVAASVQAAETRADAAQRITELKRMQEINPTPEGADEIAYFENILKALPIEAGAKPIDKLEINKQINTLRKALRELPEGPSPQREDLQAEIDFLSGAKEAKANITKVGVAIGTNKPVFLDENENQMYIYEMGSDGKQKRVLYTGGVDQKTSSSTVSVTSGVGEKEVVKGLAGLDVEDIKIARDNKRTAMASNQALQKLSSLNDNGLITGAFARNRVGVANLFNTLGLLSKNDAKDLAASQEYEKVGADLIFQSLRGKLGAGISNADRDFIRELFPQLETSAAARRQLIEYIAEKNNAVIKEADSAEAWVRKYKSLEGYKSLVEGVFEPRLSTGIKAMTVDQLKAAIAAEKKRKGR